jgi:hypothetical protein
MSGVDEPRFRENTHLLIVFDAKNSCHYRFRPLRHVQPCHARRSRVYTKTALRLVHIRSASNPSMLLAGSIGYAAVGLATKWVRLNVRRSSGTGSAKRNPCPNLMPRERTRLR